MLPYLAPPAEPLFLVQQWLRSTKPDTISPWLAMSRSSPLLFGTRFLVVRPRLANSGPPCCVWYVVPAPSSPPPSLALSRQHRVQAARTTTLCFPMQSSLRVGARHPSHPCTPGVGMPPCPSPCPLPLAWSGASSSKVKPPPHPAHNPTPQPPSLFSLGPVGGVS